MKDELRTYTTDTLKVSWSKTRCIHFAACVRGLPEVFDTDKNPWIQPDQAAEAVVIETVHRCPTGALHVYKDGNLLEEAPQQNTISVAPDGPLYIHGNITVANAAGETVVKDKRMALCRCGASAHKPYCDGSHTGAGFKDSGALTKNMLKQTATEGSDLTIVAAKDGPLRLDGSLTLKSVGNLTTYTGNGGALCRCGASAHKPFCDGSHKRVGFETD